MGPVHDVMGVTPALRAVTAGEATVAIPDHHGTADPRRDHLCAPTDVERLGAPPRDDPAHGCVTGQTPGGLRRDRAHTLELCSRAESSGAGTGRVGRRQAFLQGLQVHGDGDVRALASDEGAIV
jgi:hypothetical protein